MTYPTVPLGELVTITSGFAFRSELFNDEGRGLPLIRIRDVVPGATSTYYSGVYKNEFVVEDGDALIGMDGEFNLSRWKGGRALLNQRVCRVESLSPQLDQEFLLQFLPAALKRIEDRTPFVTVKHLSVKDLREIEVPLPSLAEQRRIAAILDKADTLRAKRREAIAKLDQLLQSVFLDMFGDPVTNPKKWPKEVLAGLARKIGSGSTPKGGDSSYQDEGISFIRSLNVHDGSFRHRNLAFIDEVQANKLNAVTVEPDDVLLNITGASVARVCRVPREVLPARVNQHVSIIRCSSRLSPAYLEHALMSPSMKSVLLRMAGAGATREAITKKQIEELLVPVPPIDVQRRFSLVAQKVADQGRSMLINLEAQERLFAAIQTSIFAAEA